MRIALLSAFVAILAFAVVGVHADDATDKFEKRAAQVCNAVANAHVSQAKLYARSGLNQLAKRQYERALELNDDHEAARAALGYKKDKEKGWVLDSKRAPAFKDAASVPDKDRAACKKALNDLCVACLKEFLTLAKVALAAELESAARVSHEQALYYDATNEIALKGAGWEKTPEGDWLSPGDVAERNSTKEALDAAAKPEKLEEMPDWVGEIWAKGSGRRGVKAGRVKAYGTHKQLEETAKYAQAACAICDELLGKREDEISLAFCDTDAAYEAYCKRLHPDDFDLVKEDFVVGATDVAIKLATDQQVTLERTVYAVALCEIRGRCGVVDFPWFELGFASYLTQRLTGRVSLTEIDSPALPKRAGSWKRTLKQSVAMSEQPLLREVIAAKTLNEMQIVYAHFFTRFLCVQHKDQLAKLCKLFNGDPIDEEAAFTDALEDTFDGLQKAFLAWFAHH